VERHTAVHVWISELLSSSFIQQEDAPAVAVLPNGTAYNRVRIYGVVVSTDELVVDDGSGSIVVKTFDAPSTLTIGDPVLIIGRPRQYSNQYYLLGEIVKPIDSKWLELRNKQHPQQQQTNGKSQALALIRKLDTGDGTDYNEVVTKLGAKGEEIIVHLLSVGELFETRPGRLKILE